MHCCLIGLGIPVNWRLGDISLEVMEGYANEGGTFSIPQRAAVRLPFGTKTQGWEHVRRA